MVKTNIAGDMLHSICNIHVIFLHMSKYVHSYNSVVSDHQLQRGGFVSRSDSISRSDSGTGQGRDQSAAAKEPRRGATNRRRARELSVRQRQKCRELLVLFV